MSLTHVCIWNSKIGYRRITIEEACERYSYRVSARSGHFICELCAQNVLLTSPGKNSRHFRHDSNSPNKECDERQAHFDSTYGRSLRGLNSYAMPLHLAVTGSNFSLQLGFFYPPDHNAHCDKIKIVSDSHQVFEYSFERIDRIGITYLNAGSIPSQNYEVEYVNSNAELRKFWANKIPGINVTGSFFDGRTRQILQSGGKAYWGSFYYLLQPYLLYSHHEDIEVTEVASAQVNSSTTWHLYKIGINKFSKHSANFFFKYAIFLTGSSSKFYPVWPPYFKDPYFIYHNSNDFYFYLCGDDAELKAYPAEANVLDTQDGKLYELHTREREQIVSFGKSGALGFSYLIKQPLIKEVPLPEVVISDHSGNTLTEECYTKLPKSKFISVSCLYDGKAVVQRKGKTEYLYKLSADQSLLIDGLSFGTEIYFYQGRDCVRILRFDQEKSSKSIPSADEAFVKKLRACSGSMIPVSHAISVIANRYAEHPQTKQWLYVALRHGEIPRKALQLLKDQIPDHHGRDNND